MRMKNVGKSHPSLFYLILIKAIYIIYMAIYCKGNTNYLTTC